MQTLPQFFGFAVLQKDLVLCRGGRYLDTGHVSEARESLKSCLSNELIFEESVKRTNQVSLGSWSCDGFVLEYFDTLLIDS
ncbi:hypothetical protein TNCT_241991 [Trichonephila clavata]|uniref:Uncharacterized protein n=1 Tax=Trichonephila clavata TaxID=2740835 RepID=A0A8X6EY77_TRICU|nr:hypothetical protein TNCT_241991 [Trichonephila clavata]